MMTPLQEIRLADPVSVQNLTIFPLIREGSEAEPDYIPSSIAIEERGMRVEELVEEGAVPNLMVINPADIAILLIDGEELRGAKQNRIINTSILIPPQSRTKIDVSCTESGRWSYNSPVFSHSKSIMPAKSRRRKNQAVSHSLMASQSYASDQGQVWQEVDELHQKMGSHSKTRAMADAVEAAREELDRATSACPWTENQYGLLAFIDGKPTGLDLLSRQSVYREVHSQLIQSYAMEALANQRDRMRGPEGKPAPSKSPVVTLEEANAFLQKCAGIEGKSYPSVGLGDDWRFQKGSISGSGLKVGDTWVHLAYFLEDENGASAPRKNRIVRASRRSRNRRHNDDDIVY